MTYDFLQEFRNENLVWRISVYENIRKLRQTTTELETRTPSKGFYAKQVRYKPLYIS